ncbi:ABC transporter ATP-binding protein [Leucobacter sp. wl10]|uniref:ABC transporter ATP-binding protein n=1 Tax=Leucobacter sp. wl10 TaxID=2304677 RepID=UPI000E5BB5A6|nr:ATP-binding cassette domain-containing protein [Leucobacter sp. wl10]RGE23324.1 ABC transporter ATP-binding protein [Leucobacter sp. wl10]
MNSIATRAAQGAETPEPLLDVRDAVVSYRVKGKGRFIAVQGVDLEVRPGEIVGIVGESGCGKSSLARALVGINRLSGGSIRFLGEEVRPLPIRRRPDALVPLQMVFQDPYASLNPRRRIVRQLKEVWNAAARARGEARAPEAGIDAITDVLERVGIDPALRSRYPHALSGGQRQRIAIAKALLAKPRVIVADEPISALDASSQKHVGALLRGLVDELRIGMVIISHDLAVVATIADRTAVMRAGRFVEQGPTERVWTAPEASYTLELLSAVPELVGRESRA